MVFKLENDHLHNLGYSFSTYAKSSEKLTFLTPLQILEKSVTIKLTKIPKEVNWLGTVSLLLTLSKDANAKGEDDFATKTTSMKSVEGKSSGFNKQSEK